MTRSTRRGDVVNPVYRVITPPSARCCTSAAAVQLSMAKADAGDRGVHRVMIVVLFVITYVPWTITFIPESGGR